MPFTRIRGEKDVTFSGCSPYRLGCWYWVIGADIPVNCVIKVLKPKVLWCQSPWFLSFVLSDDVEKSSVKCHKFRLQLSQFPSKIPSMTGYASLVPICSLTSQQILPCA